MPNMEYAARCERLRKSRDELRDALIACEAVIGQCAGEERFTNLSDAELGRMWIAVGKQARLALANAAKED